MRILAISDLHGHLPDTSGWPKADALLIGGDICPDFAGNRVKNKHGSFGNPDRQLQWLEQEFFPWLRNIDANRKFYTFGNHDWLTPEMVRDDRCIVDAEVRLTTQHGEDVRVWFSPWSNRFMDWAWMLHREQMAAKMAEIPEGIDVIVSHGPPFGIRDQAGAVWNNDHLGSQELLERIMAIKPRVVICGHIHGGFGYEPFKHEPIVLNPEAPLQEQQVLVKLTQVYNVAQMDEGYDPVHGPTLITV